MEYGDKMYQIEKELTLIKIWFHENDWHINKVLLGEWENTHPLYVAYLEERALKRELQDSLTNELNLLEV